jgi:putative heme-binding domain-containing protein
VLALLTTMVTGLALVLAAKAPRAAAGAAKLELRPGDHLCLIGNTLADRMQHDGWLETLLHSRFPKHDLVIRNLGFSGDELTLRLRSASFGSPDQWLPFNKADVIFAFFGYNESFAGAAGLDKFKQELDIFVKHTLGQKYNGKAAPRLVLFSPVAHENLKDRNLPDGNENNQRLALYTAAMAEVAGANKVPFVDLFKPTQELYAKAKQPLTFNGVHLTEEGNRQLAQVIDQSLFADEPKRDPQLLAKIRQAVLDKNFHWFNRYRTTDGYSIYGGRADLRFVDGQTNRDVMQREMQILDVMTANRDKRIWAIAASGGRESPEVDDSNTPPFIPVKTNRPGAGLNGLHLILGGEESLQKMTVGKGLKVNLFASEEMFPELINPVQMAFDTKGRLWVATWPTYPHWKPKEEMNDRLVILEDTNGDGKADRCKTFAENLHNPTGFEFWGGGVIVAMAPDLLFLKDTDGDDKADVRRRILHGLDSADTHHTSNSFILDPGGALYFQEGTFHHTQVETPYGPPARCANAGVFRYEPRAQKFEVYITYPFANPHGHIFDRWGQDIVVDGTGSQPYHAALFSGRMEYPQKHARPPQVYQQRTRPCPGIEILSSRHFPDEFQGNLLVGNVIGFQGILRYRIDDRDSSFAGTELEPILFSSDPNFRPSDFEMGPDGALYFTDWHNPIIGHMQHNLRDPSRDKIHGRVYRVTYEGRPLLTPAKVAGEPIDKLLDLLKEPEDRVRYRARIELSGRDSDQVIAAVQKWVAGLDRNAGEYEHQLLEALWVHQHHNVVNIGLLKRLLRAQDFRARAAATRVLCYWRDRVADALELFKQQAADSHPRIRLEAIRAASFFTLPEAVEIVLIASEHPSDVYIDYTRGETMKTLDPYVKKAIADGRPIAFTTPAGARFFLKTVSTDDLLKMKRSREVYAELLARKGVQEEYRRQAVAGLAKLDNKTELRVLLEAIQSQDAPNGNRDEGALFDLARLLTSRETGELAAIRGELEKLATSAALSVTRQLGFVALVAADGKIDKAWELTARSARALQDLVSAMPLIRDPGVRASLYPKVEPLLKGLPKELAATLPKGKVVPGRYVRIELPGRQKTLTLAEVEVYSDGRNIAPMGKASQKDTAHGGDARRGIDGNKSGRYGDGGQTHSQEGTANPWWEVDLGAEFPIDSVVIYNRTDGNFGNRLAGFNLRVLDKDRKPVSEQRRLAAPEVKAAFEVGGESPERIIRRAVMNALVSVRGQETQTFKTLAKFIREDMDQHAAIQALQRIPAIHWPKEEAGPLLDSLLGSLRKVPVQERTSPAVLDTMQLADALAAMLPLAEAKQIRKELGELGVRVIRLGTVPDQMIYDKDRLAVKAGRPVEIIFENTDLMPHNFVLTQPGALQEIGTLAEATATQPGALEQHYVPASPKIILGSRLLQPREAQTLRFTAPAKPGVYPYVCTYPGHWLRMHGALYVVEDIDEYQADPEAYLTKNQLPIADELLKFIRPRTEWRFDDLLTAVEKLDHGRSFNTGKQMFQVATCVACHQMNGAGTPIGPDLMKLDPKLTPTDILRDLLEPSFRINEQFQTHLIETQEGKIITGLVVEETPEIVKIIDNPLAKAEPITLKKADIAERKKSSTSVMPKGLLDKLTREEILDLMAYLIARGDQQHKLFQGGHQHGH